MIQQTESAKFEDQRGEERIPVSFRSVLIECDLFGEQVEILNIARLGFLARTRVHRATGDVLRIHFPELGMLEASVVWSGKGMLGGRFHDAIDESRFNDFVANRK